MKTICGKFRCRKRGTKFYWTWRLCRWFIIDEIRKNERILIFSKRWHSISQV